MNDQVLTDDEKDALIDGVENGEVEVQTGNGLQYASVRDFDVTPRNRIVTDSFPKLQNLNRKLAGSISQSTSVLLNEKVEVESGPLASSTWAEFCELSTDVALIFEFKAMPLDGSAAIYVQSGVIRHLVEAFYGGSKENPPRHAIDGFTPGEMNVISLFCMDILKGIVATWQSLILLEPEKVGVHQSTDVVEVIESSAIVIHSEFTLHAGDERHDFHIVWPTSMLASLLPVLEGAKRERDAQEDARWEQVIRARVPEALVDVSSRVGNARMSLREVAALQAGDVIDIENPRIGTVFAKHVPVLEGRFGVHDGCYAIEATRWLADVEAAQTASG
ncbi:MAG: FliM/FliN family flagellar motor switch protein [Gammaproteobacteria bacterium]|nr:FliM/FliN family flagellar motor switch protein [Gammaproteobacteria bacterium]